MAEVCLLVAEDMVPRMLALPTTAPPNPAPAELQQGSASRQQGQQSLLAIPQQRLHRLKSVLMGNRSDQQQNFDAPLLSVEQQSQQQQLQLDSDKQQVVGAQQNRLSRLSGTLQSLQARLRGSTQNQQLLATQTPIDTQQGPAQVQGSSQGNMLKHSDQQPEPAPADTNAGTQPDPIEPETRIQKLARLTWRRTPALDAAVVVHGNNGQSLQPGMGTGTVVSAIQHASKSTKQGAAYDCTVNSAASSEHGSNAAVASSAIADTGIALDAAINEPVSLLRSFSQKLNVFNRQTFNAGNARSADVQNQLTAHSSNERAATRISSNIGAKQSDSYANTVPPVTQPDRASTPALQLDQQDNTTPLPSAASPRQPLSTWQRLSSQLGLQVSSAFQGAGSRVRAVAALLPSYPTYVHIGSHQILLPASPALTEAVQSAQQQGPAEQQRQALLMHSMAAYRGRALAICRLALPKSWSKRVL